MTRLDVIKTKKKRINELRREIMNLEEVERVEIEGPRLKKLIGKVFKFRNSYSCPEGEKDKWWLYARLVAVDDEGSMTVQTIQIDKNGKLEMDIGEHFYTKHFPDGYQKSTKAEWNRVLKQIDQRVADFKEAPNVNNDT